MALETRESLQEREYKDKGPYHWSISIAGGVVFQMGIENRKTDRLVRWFHPGLLRYRAAISIIQPHMDQLLTKNMKPRILDLGGGDGFMAGGMIAPRWGNNADLFNCDISYNALYLSRLKNDKVSNTQARDRLPFKSESFDVITALEVLEHVEDGLLFLKEAKRVLCEKGIMVISTPSKKYPINLKHREHYDKSSLTSVLESAGFDDYSVIGYRFSPYKLIRYAAYGIDAVFRLIKNSPVGIYEYKKEETGRVQDLPDGYIVLCRKECRK
ncbi:hypothetical protein A3D03_01700 [Candidatus Gottesmanbacteria bacterium RIFCSPHIGHO2_02_FULL_40_13]|uniref:Methyltransferase type 11 domain-containing protein n=1 Tax=Candidatus Gottesmanbacteria bacterium RIFCSPHIGHO2_02_FULL_40_13 TaxID=1798384 RepID=A0A1F6A7C0_9BACT|nr:MAG: hypothetical protein A3D03_01700 [Candidatus Gottesmanbacteria bacterium RIFCSPHIGHO2_02_FULL_40_13]